MTDAPHNLTDSHRHHQREGWATVQTEVGSLEETEADRREKLMLAWKANTVAATLGTRGHTNR